MSPAPVPPAASGLSPAAGFLLRALGFNLLLFAILRLPAVEQGVLLPLARAELGVVVTLFGAGEASVEPAAECSGADAIALCLATLLAYPASRPRRLVGAAVAVILLAAFNLVRIASLAKAAGEPARFELLHLWVWPALLIVFVSVYLFAWMQRVDAAAAASAGPMLLPAGRFVGFSAIALLVLVAVTPWLLAWQPLLRLAAAEAHAVAGALRLVGVSAEATDGILVTPRGAFEVTPECLATPLLPVALGALLAFTRKRSLRLVGLALALPLFALLGALRLLVLAAPTSLLPAPEDAAHAFFQVTAGVVLVVVMAFRAAGVRSAVRGESRPPRPRAILGGILGAIAAGLLLAALAWPVGPGLLRWLGLAGRWVGVSAPPDPQGALALLPAFQLGLFLALVVVGARPLRPRALLLELSALLASMVVLVSLAALAGGLPILVVRAWALALPALLAGCFRQEAADFSEFQLSAQGRPRQAMSDRYRAFWDDVGEHFPDLGGAASTACYRAAEERLIRELLPDLANRRLLKTDLWDEAKNTRILGWASGEGALCFGIDIAHPIAAKARRMAGPGVIHAVVADVRQLPFPGAAFDAIYSMGTIEHFADPEVAVAEMYRVLRPGGAALIGVPNRFDPFLRPLLVLALRGLGLYAYGRERSFSRRGLNQLLESAGFAVEGESGILFVPGWLRMLDLAAHVWWPPLAAATGPAVRCFARLERRFRSLQRRGYLIASLGRKPG